MINLSLQNRSEEEKPKQIREKGQILVNLYGPETKNSSLKADYKEFSKAFEETGYSGLISLKIGEKTVLALIHEVQKDPLSDEFIHVDFYSPRLKEKIHAKIPLVFEGESPAAKEGGTLVRNIQEVEVRALPQDLPKEIIVDISGLKTLEDEILIKDLQIPSGVEIQKSPDEIVAHVSPLEKVEEELEKPIEEKVEEVEKAEKPEKEGKEEEESAPKKEE
jgi:large subunit ribosomal protein L25